MNATITLKNGGVYKGYFSLATYNLTINKDDEGHYYHGDSGRTMRLRSLNNTTNALENAVSILETDYHFHNYIKRNLFSEIRIYPSITMIRQTGNPGKLPTPAYLGVPVLLTGDQVEDVVVHIVYTCEPGAGIDSICSLDDMLWLTSSIQEQRGLASVGNCGYDAILFTHNKSNVDVLLNRLRLLYKKGDEQVLNVEEYNVLQNLINEQIELLRKEHVIIISFCSC